MDPVSGFSLAVNVLAVVDFSRTFLEVLGQVSEAGSPATTQHIGGIVRSLQTSNAKVKSQSRDGHDEKAFTDLVDECQKISDELLAFVEEVSVSQSSTMVSRIKTTTRTMWNHSMIEQKKARLEAIRAQLLFDIVVPMAAKVDAIPDTKLLDAQTQTLLDAIRTGQDTDKAMLEHFHRFYEDHAASQYEQHTETVSLLRDLSLRLEGHPQSQPLERPEEDQMHKQRVLKRIRESLHFDRENDRYDDIENAHKATFEWIYHEPPSGATQATWSEFQSWLVEQNGVYWISGKAGSGKSTLMKFLSRDNRTMGSLTRWAAGGHLLVLSFYFWNPGTRLQKSLEGLFRAILLQALEQCPELAEKIFPDRFQSSMQWGEFPTMHQLKRAFASLTAPGLKDAAGVPLKVALFVDGLDEFDPGATTLADLADLFTSVAASSFFKALLSSRPENEFEDAFRDTSKLRLHHLTKMDVIRYVNDMIHDHPRMLQLASQNPAESQGLVSEIVEAAQGVFLWVKLVVRSLLEGLRNHDDICTLTERLRELPSDLEDLFRRMLLRIPDRYKQSMSQTFQLLRSSTELQTATEALFYRLSHPLTALGLHFALLDTEDVLKSEIRQFSHEVAYSEIHSVEVRIKSRCAGLIELKTSVEHLRAQVEGNHKGKMEATHIVTSSSANDEHHWVDPKLQFVHRSVVEYLWKEDVWNGILTETETIDFHPRHALLKGLVMQAKKCPCASPSYAPGVPNSEPWPLVCAALEIERQLEIEDEAAQLELLNALDTAITTRCGPQWWDTYQEAHRRPKWHDNFFAFAVRYGLWRYVVARLQTLGQASMHKSGRPLLDYACRPAPEHGMGFKGLDVRTVEALLLHGADPNAKFNGFSPWQNALYTFPFELDRLLPIFKVFLGHGADPNAYIEKDYRISNGVSQKRRYSAFLLVQRSLRGDLQDLGFYLRWPPAEKEIMKSIMKTLEKKGAKSKEWRMEKGFFFRHREASPRDGSRCTVI